MHAPEAPDTSLGREGTCPGCGRVIAEARAEPRAPWHFKLLMVALAIYLTWRFIQIVGWLL